MIFRLNPYLRVAVSAYYSFIFVFQKELEIIPTYFGILAAALACLREVSYPGNTLL